MKLSFGRKSAFIFAAIQLISTINFVSDKEFITGIISAICMVLWVRLGWRGYEWSSIELSLKKEAK
jgi:hypothetical protein